MAPSGDVEAEFRAARREVVARYGAGELDLAEASAREALGGFPAHRAEATYWVASLRSLRGDEDGAIAVLVDASEHGMWWSPRWLADPDFERLRDRPEFAEVAARSEGRFRASAWSQEAAVRIHRTADPAAGTLVVLHGWTADDRDMEARWLVGASAGCHVVYVRSSQPGCSDGFEHYWIARDLSERDVRAGLQAARRELGRSVGRLCLGGFSRGAGVALELGLLGRPARFRGVIAMAPVTELEGIALGPASERGVRVDLLVGEADSTRGATGSLADRLSHAGVPNRLTVIAGLAHDLPEDFEGRLLGALRYVGRSG